MPNFGTTICNYSWKMTNGFLSVTIGAMFDTIHPKLANAGTDGDSQMLKRRYKMLFEI